MTVHSHRSRLWNTSSGLSGGSLDETFSRCGIQKSISTSHEKDSVKQGYPVNSMVAIIFSLGPVVFNKSIPCAWVWGQLGLRGHASKGIACLQPAHKFDTGLTMSACKGASLLASFPTQVLQVPIPASCHPLRP